MQNNKKICLILAVVILLVIGFALVGLNKSSRGDMSTIKIGAILPLTGSQAFLGEGMKNALEMAKKNLGNTKYKYEVIYADDAFDAKMAISAANKLISVDKVDVIVDAYAPIGNAVSPITEKASVVHIDVAFDPKIAEGDYNFILFTTPDTAARSFLAEMQKRGMTKLEIIHVNNQGIFSVFQALQKSASEYGVTIVGDEIFNPGERDFRSMVTKASKNKPDLYALLAVSPELELVAKQMHDQNIFNISSTIYLELAKDKTVFEGLWSIGFGKVDSSFENQYRSTYNRELTYGVANLYDAFNLVVKISEANQGNSKPSREYLMQSLKNMPDTEGVLGMLHINPEGIIDNPVALKIIKDGKMVMGE